MMLTSLLFDEGKKKTFHVSQESPRFFANRASTRQSTTRFTVIKGLVINCSEPSSIKDVLKGSFGRVALPHGKPLFSMLHLTLDSGFHYSLSNILVCCRHVLVL